MVGTIGMQVNDPESFSQDANQIGGSVNMGVRQTMAAVTKTTVDSVMVTAKVKPTSDGLPSLRRLQGGGGGVVDVTYYITVSSDSALSATSTSIIDAVHDVSPMDLSRMMSVNVATLAGAGVYAIVVTFISLPLMSAVVITSTTATEYLQAGVDSLAHRCSTCALAHALLLLSLARLRWFSTD